MRTYFGIHNHTYYSNIRLLDSTNKPKDLIDKAIELGMNGIAITDHECLSAHMEANQYAKEIQKSYPDFKVALGNEIYLVDERGPGQKYYHFILIAKDEIGHKALRELSSTAWYNSYTDRGMERVPTTKNELAIIVQKYPGHLIATTACRGGELSSWALLHARANEVNDTTSAKIYEDYMIDFLYWGRTFFGDDFYIECAPSTDEEQILINQTLLRLAQKFNVKMVVGTDAHYLTKTNRFVHKAYLNSKDGDREIDDFYEFTYLMDFDECESLLCLSFGGHKHVAAAIIENTLEVQDKIQSYSLERKQIIPKVNVEVYPRQWSFMNKGTLASYTNKFPLITQLCLSEEVQERYWINECLKELINKNQWNDEYLNRIEIEADVIKYIGEKLDDCLFAYFNTFKHYIDLFWECGSIVGPGRGSATGFLSNYLLGIT